ncbi:MAG: hypothetical protein RL145_2076, partial [Pseudomonadota bacterium]
RRIGAAYNRVQAVGRETDSLCSGSQDGIAYKYVSGH